MPAFVRANLRPGVEPPSPPPGPPPTWMAKRPAGLMAIVGAFGAGELDLDALRRFRRPVYFALGGLSNPDQYLRIAERLAGVFDDFTRRTGASLSGWPDRCASYGLAPNRPRPQRAKFACRLQDEAPRAGFEPAAYSLGGHRGGGTSG
jgi:hypothetical protein